MKKPSLGNKEIFDRFYQYLGIGASPRYYEAVHDFLEKYRASLGSQTPDHDSAIAFLSRYKHCSINTRSTYANYLKGFFRRFDGSSLPVHIRVEHRLGEFVTILEYLRLLVAAEAKTTHQETSVRDFLIIQMLANTGLRRGELAACTVGDLSLTSHPPVVVVRHTKGRRDRSGPLPEGLAARLRAYVAGKERDDSVFGLGVKGISSLFARIARRAGLPHLHPHSLRHYYATTLYQNGIGVLAIKQLLGHTSLETTQTYLALHPSELSEAVNTLEGSVPPPVPAPPA